VQYEKPPFSINCSRAAGPGKKSNRNDFSGYEFYWQTSL